MKRFVLLLACLALPVAAAESVKDAAKDAAKPAINLDIGTPPVIVVKHSLAQRSSRLIRFYEAGEIGLGHDGFIYLRDNSRMTLAKRQIAEKLIDAENPERKALIQALADSNGRRDAEPEILGLMRERWHQQWKSGWWLRDAEGKWSRKP
ncbi:MAG: YdbL family protein [Sulfuritalea sp.]|nr:YdbL family protein [Sulfuritalea sp.]